MTRKAQFSDKQKHQATQIALQRGLTCPDCGGSEPVPVEDEVRAHQDGGAEVLMRCEACEGTSEMALVLSPEEAEALGLHSLGGDREAP